MGKILVLDSTFRDGRQGAGNNLSLSAALELLPLLDRFGVDIIELGWPGASNFWDALIAAALKKPLKNARLAVFGATRKPGLTVETDRLFGAVINSPVPIAVLFGKTWLRHVKEALLTDGETNRKLIEESIAAAVKAGREVIFDAEHYFQSRLEDGPEYALSCLSAAVRGGAKTLCLCDTNGAADPFQTAKIVREADQFFQGKITIGVHMHNDNGFADANTFAAVAAGGARHFQGTLNGVAERAGMACTIVGLANLHHRLPALVSKNYHPELSASLSEKTFFLAGLNPDPRKPFVGDCVSTHKAGVHASAVRRSDPSLYENHPPEIYGQKRRFVISSSAGRASIFAFLEAEFGFLTGDTAMADAVLAEIEENEKAGYQYDLCRGSAAVLLGRHLFPKRRFVFGAVGGKVISILGDGERNSTAFLKTKSSSFKAEAAGNGPVDAVFKAVLKILPENHPAAGLEFRRYRDFELPGRPGSEAEMRVEIEWQSKVFGDFATQGISTSIIDAALKAIIEAVEFAELPARPSRRGLTARS